VVDGVEEHRGEGIEVERKDINEGRDRIRSNRGELVLFFRY
jgi:hypothetical protein